MAINVSSWSIRNPIPSVLLFVMLTLIGIVGFRAMKIQQFPDIDLPTVTVVASLPGAAPAQMETEVARKIENSIATLQGIKHIYTKVQDGTATITVEFRLEKPTQEAVDDVRDAVTRIRSDLPGDLRDPMISKVNLSGAPILTYTVDSERLDDEALSWFVDNTVTKSMLAVRGVGAVARVGGVNREIRVELDPARMLALNASAADISRQLRQIQQEASGGRADIGGVEQSVRTIGTVQSAAELAAMDIALSDGRRIRLDQVATVSDTVAEQRSAALLNGRPVVGFEITRSRGAGEIDVADGVRAQLEKLKAEHPHIRVTEAFNFVDPVQENFDGSMWLLLEGALLAVLVVWLFLRDWRATLVSAAALPLSILPTFGAMYFLGFSLNVVTLLSLSLVVGILVDDAIVEIENIMRHLRMGKTPYQAAMEAADEIGLAVIATSFTLIAVFLPTAFMSGVPGKFFVQFGWAAAISVFFSLVVARMLTPMMAAYILHKPKKEHRQPRWLTIYLGWAQWCLKHRIATLLGAAVFFFGSFALVPLLPTGFIPPDDLSQTQVYVTLPPGSTFKQTLAAAEQARAIVEKNPHVKLVYTAIGGGAAGSNPFEPRGAAEARKATLTINLTPRGDRGGTSKQAIEGELRAALTELPGARITVGLAGAQEKYVLVLAGENGAVLADHARKVERELRTIPGIGGVTTTASLVRPELVVRPDFARAADLGVTSAAIADTLRIATAGDYDQGLAKLNLSQRQIPIVVKLPPDARQDLAAAGTAAGAGQERPGDARQRRAAVDRRRPGRDRPLRPPAQHQLRDRTQRPAARRGREAGAGVAEPAEPAAGRDPDHGRRRRSDERTLRQFRPRDAHRRAVHLHRAGAAVQGLRAAGDDPGRAGAVDPRRVPGAVRHAVGAVDAVDDRAHHADGHRDEELDPADRLRDPRAPRSRPPALGGDHRRLPQACATDRDDDGGDGCRHDADRDRAGHRPELPRADGDCRDRRLDHLDLPQPARGTGRLHLCRRLPFLYPPAHPAP